MYVVLVTQTVVTCQSIVVEAPDEAAAIAAGIEKVSKDGSIDMVEVSSTWAGEVTRAIVPAVAPAQDPHGKKTVAMKKLESVSQATEHDLLTGNRLCCLSRHGDPHTHDCPNMRKGG